jgi:hypothetical protein
VACKEFSQDEETDRRKTRCSHRNLFCKRAGQRKERSRKQSSHRSGIGERGICDAHEFTGLFVPEESGL